jgi:hypothetical protein
MQIGSQAIEKPQITFPLVSWLCCFGTKLENISIEFATEPLNNCINQVSQIQVVNLLLCQHLFSTPPTCHYLNPLGSKPQKGATIIVI